MPISALSSTHVSHLESLRKKHSALSNEIEEARKNPSTSDFFLNTLKKQKLMVKEKLMRFERTMVEAAE